MIIGTAISSSSSIALIQDLPPIKDVPILEIKPEYSEDEVKTLTEYYGDKYGVSPNIMLNVIRCETHFRNKQSDIYSNGVREDSWGISQFHLPSQNKYNGKIISKDMALDPNIAVEAMAQIMSKGQYSKWSCYRKLYVQ